MDYYNQDYNIQLYIYHIVVLRQILYIYIDQHEVLNEDHHIEHNYPYFLFHMHHNYTLKKLINQKEKPFRLFLLTYVYKHVDLLLVKNYLYKKDLYKIHILDQLYYVHNLHKHHLMYNLFVHIELDQNDIV